MWGDFPSLSTGPSEARGNGSTIAGVGLTPEGVWHNPPAFDLMLENAYRSGGVDLDGWARGYAGRRYGAATPTAQRALADAWSIFGATAYAGHDGEMVSKVSAAFGPVFHHLLLLLGWICVG